MSAPGNTGRPAGGAGEEADPSPVGEPPPSLWTIRTGRIDPADKDGDAAYIVRTWSETYDDLPQARWLRRREYKKHVIEPTLARSQVLVAADTEDQWHILGFVVYERGVGSHEVLPGVRMETGATAHYLAVVERWRGRGIGSALLRAAGIEPTASFFGTHHTERAFRGRLVYMPSLLRQQKGPHVAHAAPSRLPAR